MNRHKFAAWARLPFAREWQALNEQFREADLPPPTFMVLIGGMSIAFAGLLVATGWVAAL